MGVLYSQISVWSHFLHNVVLDLLLHLCVILILHLLACPWYFHFGTEVTTGGVSLFWHLPSTLLPHCLSYFGSTQGVTTATSWHPGSLYLHGGAKSARLWRKYTHPFQSLWKWKSFPTHPSWKIQELVVTSLLSHFWNMIWWHRHNVRSCCAPKYAAQSWRRMAPLEKYLWQLLSTHSLDQYFCCWEEN